MIYAKPKTRDPVNGIGKRESVVERERRHIGRVWMGLTEDGLGKEDKVDRSFSYANI